MKKQPSEQYSLHRIALAPLLPEKNRQQIIQSLKQVLEIDESRLLGFLTHHGLGPSWESLLRDNECKSYVSANFLAKLNKDKYTNAALYLLQSQALKTVKNALEHANVPHVIIKGAHIRELVYSSPALRPVFDLDILVSKESKDIAMRSLINNGFTIHPSAGNISHEVTLTKGGNIYIDLHWDIMRPGRVRSDLTDELLAHRQQYASHWGLDDSSSTFLMLVHPVFTKYVTTPLAHLVRLLDMVLWIKLRTIDWDKVYYWIDLGGLRTAAWIMSEWLKMITEIELPSWFVQKIQPGGIKTSYLKYWLDHDLSSQFIESPLIIHSGLTLPAHDSFTDCVRVLVNFYEEKRLAKEKLKRIKSALEMP